MRVVGRRDLSAGLTIAVVLGVAACSDEDDRDDGAHVDRGARMDEAHSVSAALLEVPLDAVGDGQLLVQTADLRAATEAAGLDFPTDGSREATTQWLTGLTSDPDSAVHVPMGDSLNVQAASPDDFAEVAGWSVIDVDSFVEYAVPPGTFAVVAGDFDDDTLDPDLVDVGGGVVSDREGEDHEADLSQVNAVNRLGQPTRFARHDDRIAISTSTPSVGAWLADGETLADDKGLAEVAEALDDEDAVSAVLSRIEDGAPEASLGKNLTQEQIKSAWADLDELVPQDPFDTVGIGWGVDDGTPEVHVAYHFGSSSAAEDAAPVLGKHYREGTSLVTRQPYSDLVDVEDAEADGPVVTVTVTTTDEGRVNFLHQALLQRDGIFASR